MKRISILGSTGTIGTNALQVARTFKDRITVTALAAEKNWKELARQIREFRPAIAVLHDCAAFKKLKRELGGTGPVKLLCGTEGLVEAATFGDVDMVLSAVSGTSGIIPTYSAVKAGKNVALANKESLVSAGELINAEAARSGSKILPVDSEHSALFQLLEGKKLADVKRLVLPASGGPFLNVPFQRFRTLTVQDALNHPVWRMGRKITIDSATLANKGLEVIEAHHLFGIGFNRISVVIHPQCIFHGFVEMNDGALYAHMGCPDMQLPITHALFHPERVKFDKRLSLTELGSLTIHGVDRKKFPFLQLAYQVGRRGGSWPAVFNAADEVAVNGFLDGALVFTGIYDVVEETVAAHQGVRISGIGDIIEAEDWARRKASEIIRNKRKTYIS